MMPTVAAASSSSACDTTDTGNKISHDVVSDDDDCSPCLGDLAWDDILFSKILPLLSWRDLFRLRSTSWECKLIVEGYFRQLKNIDLSLTGCRFDLTDVAFKVLTKECNNLRSLSTRNAHWISDNDLSPVFKNNHLLTNVDLSDCTFLDGYCLLTLAVNCEQLKSLILRECNWLTHGALEMLTTHLNSIQIIDLSSCSAMSNQQLLPFLQKYKLKEIHLAFLRAVNDTTLLVIARDCGACLEMLDIRGCGNVTDRGIKMIGEYCKQLKTLHVAGCTLVTEFSLHVLRNRIVIDREPPKELVLYVPLPLQV